MPDYLSKVKKGLPVFISGLVLFIYLFQFNKFHLLHAEQMQLFRFSQSYAGEIFSKPGGFSTYIAQFIIQLYISPLLGAIIILSLLFITYLLIKKILNPFNQDSLYLALVPAFFLTALQAYHNYHLETTVAFIISTLLIYIYFKIRSSPVYKKLGILVFPVIGFALAGGFGIYLAIVFLVTELFSSNSNKLKVLLPFALSILFILIAYKVAYTEPFTSIWETCIPLRYMDLIHNLSLILLLIFFPFIFLTLRGTKILKSVKAAGVPILISCLIINYDSKTEKLFEIEYHFFKEDYAKVVTLVEKYPHSDHLVTYFGNIALSKTSQMGDRLFHYKQIFGPEGLFMTNEPLNIATLYGSELYNHLKYTNEAAHWAFNGLVTNKPTPRILKKLVIYELTNGNYQTAKKYLTLLSQSLFYKDWARTYAKYVKDPLLIASDTEISSLRKFTATKDFYHDRFDLQLKSLLSLYPDNRSAFDYLISYYLLEKNLTSFLDNLAYLREFRMRQLPIHFEEALLVCKAIMPKRSQEIDQFVIREETKTNFNKYLAIYESGSNNRKLAYQKLLKEFKFSFWFYLDFSPDVPTDKEPNVQLFPQ